MMKTNEHNMDRIIRLALGIVMLVLGWGGFVGGMPGAILQWLGFVPLITGLVGWCPLYAIFGFSTCPVKN